MDNRTLCASLKDAECFPRFQLTLIRKIQFISFGIGLYEGLPNQNSPRDRPLVVDPVELELINY